MNGRHGYPRRLQWYLLVVSVAGPLAALVLAASQRDTLTAPQAIWAGVLVAIAMVAERFALRLTHHTHVTTSTAVYVAMLLITPWTWVGVLALLAVVGAELWRGKSSGAIHWPEIAFNVGQGTAYVTAGAVCAGVLATRLPGPDLPRFGAVWAVILCAAVMHGMNTALVAGAGALQLGISPLRVWRQTFTLDFVPHVALVIVGMLAATVIVDQPLLLPLIGMPLYLMHRAVQQSIRLREDTKRALSSLVDVVELRDPYTAGHSRRVATTARLIAERLGLSAEEADLIESAGRVHDLGKVAIDPAVLMKPTKLTIEEQREIERHASLGADVLANFATYRQGTRLVRHHHERWDGRGYPDGLAGETIPLGARILAVADTFDALTSDRPYRKGMSAEKAAAILREGAGSQWDGDVVDG
ncbi:MAG: hypothetical protein C4346_00955, partial [Chloroflexota bacterium]